MSKKENISQYDKMTKTPISKLVLTLSIPSVISMLVTNIYNLVDTAFVGQLGTSASGAVGIVFGFMAIIQAFGFLFGQGAGSILSRSLGAKDKESASAHASAGFFCSLLFGIIISVVGFIWLDDIVMFLGSTVTIAPFAKTYIFYILLAAPFMSSSLTLNNLLRYEGKASLGMVGLMAGAVLNPQSACQLGNFTLDVPVGQNRNKNQLQKCRKGHSGNARGHYGDRLSQPFKTGIEQPDDRFAERSMCCVRRRGCCGDEYCIPHYLLCILHCAGYRTGIPACICVQLRRRKILAYQKRLCFYRVGIRGDHRHRQRFSGHLFGQPDCAVP